MNKLETDYSARKSHAVQKLHSVQALRALAALLVLLYHVAAIQKAELADNQITERALLSGFWDYGFSGVDMFFVISGFIMVYVSQDTRQNGKAVLKFLYARFSRIYPIWWIFAILMALCFWVLFGQPADPETIKPENVPAFLARSFALLPQKYHPVLGVGWTLVHEMFFYIMFAGLLFFSLRWRMVGLTLWGAFVVFIGVTQGSPKFSTTLYELFVSPLSLEFIIGAFVGMAVIKDFKIPALMLTICSIIAFVGLLAVGIELNLQKLHWHRVLIFTLPCAGLIWGFVELEKAGRLRVPSWLSTLGDASYVLYLSHMFVLLTIREIWQKFEYMFPEFLRYIGPGILDNVFYVTLTISGCLIFSVLAHKMLEKPLIELTRKMSPFSKA